MVQEPTITTTRVEDYSLNNTPFSVQYVLHTINDSHGEQALDEHAILRERVVDCYETPRLGYCDLPEGVSRGHQVKHRVIREVDRDLTSNNNGRRFTEIHQWVQISADLEALIDTLPDHVKGLLRKEYADLDVIPYHFGR
ncbi:hypothetical protein HYV87_04780 [Candidatus Woesearchaeota archaeon]|nr:hypothetical protein [Candidatus Woesearchaeota archaeon]